MNKLARAVILYIIFYLMCSICSACPAAPTVHTLKQADGTMFKAVQWGDEWYHGWETLDGYTILFDEESGNWVYATLDKHRKLVKTNLIVTKDRPYGIPKHLRDPNMILAVKDLKKKLYTKSLPAIGNIKIPVILINFSDTTPTFSQSTFCDLIFGNHMGSVTDYYREVSYGQLNITGIVLGWFTARNSHDYYGRDVVVPILNWTIIIDAFASKLVKEAVENADKYIDFSKFDNNRDGYVDVVVVIHQGTGQEASGNSTDIWSHFGRLSQWPWFLGGGAYKTDDGVIVDNYIIVPELLGNDVTTIGVICHELGHALGLPDLYDTDYTSFGIGAWGLMASGSWNGILISGDSPAHPCAWSKYVLGWVQPKKIEGIVNVTVRAVELYGDIYQLHDNPNGPTDWGHGGGEYFLIENRQKIGYDSALPGSGLLIWHIDERMANNNNENHKLVDLEEADGRNDLDHKINFGDLGDPYPGETNNREFGKNTNPNSNLYSGLPSGVWVSNISSSSINMTATLKVIPAVTAIPDTDTVSAGGKLWGYRIVINPTNSTYKILCVNEVFAPNGTLWKRWVVKKLLMPKEIWNVRKFIDIPNDAILGNYMYVVTIYDINTGVKLDEHSVNFTVTAS